MRVRRLVSALLLAGAVEMRADDVDSWGRAHASEVWSAFRGDLHGPGGAGEVEWRVQVVANDGWGTTAELVVTRPWKGRATVRYARTLDSNLVAQLDALHEASPRLRAGQAAARLKARRGELDEAACPAVGPLAARLPAITIAALPVNELTLHPPSYEVILAAAYRAGRTLSVEKGENDLARWCEDILAAVMACEAVPLGQ